MAPFFVPVIYCLSHVIPFNFTYLFNLNYPPTILGWYFIALQIDIYYVFIRT